ncbi:MAG: MCE family protein [Candidatus Dormibacteraeota bacterium]|nr:MCE family protein [Candidatus Dormibacteraeota bacterium]
MNAIGRRGGINPLIAGFIAGAVIVLVIGLMADINLQYGAPWSPGHTLTAQVSDADAMSVGSDVRIGGRLVGQVVSVVSKGAYTDVTFHVDDGDWPLPGDTTASVRLATLLGQKYIQLNPGHATTMLEDSSTIGLQSTKPVVDFDQILDTFDKPTRDALTQLIRTGSAAVQNQEGTLQQLIPDLSDLSVNSQVPTQELVTRNGDLNNILVNLGVTAEQLAKSRDDLASVIDNLNTVTAALASQEGKALKGYITNTDTLNLTSNQVLGGNAADQLDSGLREVGLFANYLNDLLSNTIPQSEAFRRPISNAEPSDIVNGNGGIPARASIDLIYEIGTATSQGDAVGNFFLRQNVAGIDPCGLIPNNCGLPAGLPGQGQSAPTPSLPIPSLPIPTPSLPIPTPSLPVCIPLPLLPCATPTPGVGGPVATPTPSLPIPIPTPTLPIGIDYHVQVPQTADWGWYMERMR